MSRSAAKSKAGRKGRKSTSLLASPLAQNAKVDDTTPRGTVLTPWSDMLIQEDTDEIVAEIMDDLMNSVIEGCLKIHYNRQLIPFTVSWAKKTLTQTVEHHFMCLDKGEDPDEMTRTEDFEPLPATIDSWAQGCVTVNKADHYSHHTSQQEADADDVQTVPEVSQSLDVVTQTKTFPSQSDKDPTPKRLNQEKLCNLRSSFPPLKTEGNKKQRAGLPLKHDAGRLLPSLQLKAVKVKGKDTGKFVHDGLTGSLQQEKDNKPIPKLDPRQLPKNCIFPQYEIMDTSQTKPISPRYSKQQAQWMLPSLKPLKSFYDDSGEMQRNVSPKKSFPPTQRRETVVLEPVKLDTMTLAKGVSLLKSQPEEIKPLRLNSSPQSVNTKLICSDAAMPLFSVDDVISGRPPHVTKMPQP